MIQKLEDELNTKLFDRTTQPVQPTLTGRKAVSYTHLDVYKRQMVRIKAISSS